MDEDEFLIHPDRLAAKPLVLQGTFKPGDLERLEDSLANGDGELRYRIVGQREAQRRPTLSCIIEGFVFLTCQKSLEAFRHDLSIEDRLVLVGSEAELPPVEEESDDQDYLVAEGPLDIRDLVEDAVLLALPMVPRKPGLEDAPGEGATAAQAGKESPFAALASLRKQPK